MADAGRARDSTPGAKSNCKSNAKGMFKAHVLMGFHGCPDAGHYITGMRAARIILAMEPEYIVRTTTRRHDERRLGLETTCRRYR